MERKAVAVAVLVLLLPLAVTAADIRTGDQPSINSDERITEDVYIAGGSVTNSGTIIGDLIATGGTLLINGEVRNDLLAAGGTVTVLGKMLDDVRVAGGNVIITSDVANDLVATGGNIHVGGKVGGDALIAGGAVRIDAPVTGDVRIGAGDVYINAPIGGNVQIEADKVTLGSAAVIAGDLKYRAASEITLEDGARVEGETTYTPRKNVRQGLKNGLIAFLSLWFVLKFFMLLVGAMVFGLFFRRYSEELTRRSLVQPIPEFVTGLVTVIVLPIISGVLLATVIGIPLGILGMLSFAAMVVFAHLVAPVILGSMLSVWLFRSSGTVTWRTILFGVVVFYIAGFIPFVGWIARIFFMLLALGAMLQVKWNIAKDWR